MIEIGEVNSHKLGSVPFYGIRQDDDTHYHSVIGNAYTPHGIVEVNQYWEDEPSGFDHMMMEMILGGRRFRAKVSGHHAPRQITKYAKEFARQCYLLSHPESD